jgi:hypothetical protein
MDGGGIAQWDVFVSYARANVDAVVPIAAALGARGLRVWRDEDEIESFEAITRSVRDGVSRARVLLAYYSERYPTRRACQWELTAAFLAAQRLGDPRQRVLVINPERTAEGTPRAAHIEPVQLRDAVFRAAPRPDDTNAIADLAESVVRHLRAVQGPLGVSGSLVPRSLGLRPVGSPAFVGRIPALWALHSALTAGEAMQIMGAAEGGVAQLSGVGGVGKSLLAEEYALRFAAAYPGGVFWLRASEERQTTGTHDATLEVGRDTQLRTIAAQLQIELQGRAPEEIAGAVRAHIERADGRCLWVVDDLPGGLGADRARAWFAPDANATTLLTTRTREYALLARTVQLGGLTAPDGYALLTAQRTPRGAEEQEAADGIVADLAGHPLALAVAGAALRIEAGMRSFADFRNALSHPGEDALELAAELADTLPTGHEPSIAATLLRSIDQLEEEGRDLLRVASVLAAAPVASPLIASTFAHADNLETSAARRRAARAIASTDRLSLADSADAAGETRQFHALVARTMRFHDNNTSRTSTLQTAAGAALTELLDDFIAAGAADPGRQGLIAHGRELLRRSGRETQLGHLPDRIAQYDFMRGDYRAAAAALAELLADRRETLGDEHPDTLTAMADLALMLWAQGELERPRELQEQVLEAQRRVLGQEHADSLTTMNNLALTLSAQGGLGRARELQEQVLEARRRVLGDQHPDTLTAMDNLAKTLGAQGELGDARQLQEQALEIQRRVLGEEHPDTLIVMGNLAETLRAQGELGGARALQEHVLQARRRVLGEEHPDTLIALGTFAQTLGAQGELADARQLQEQALEAQRRVLGEEHHHTLTAMGNLAATLWAQGELGDARQLQEQALEAQRRVLGEEHAEALTTMGNLAQIFWAQGELEGARNLQEQLLEASRRVLGDDHRNTLTTMDNLAATLKAQRDLGGARALQEQVLEANRRVLGEEHPDTLATMGTLVGTLWAQGDLGGARELQEHALEASRRVLGEEHRDTLIAMGNLAQMLSAHGELARARELRERVLEASRRVLGEEHRDTLIAMGNVALTLCAQGNLARARALQEQVLKDQRRVLGAEHHDTLTTMNNLALTLWDQGDLEGARELRERVLEASRRVLGEEHPDTLIAMGHVASTLAAQGEFRGAREVREQVLDASRRVLGEEHPDTLIAMGNLAASLCDEKDIAHARALQELVLETRRRVLGAQHPDTLTAMEALVGTLSAQGELGGARELQEQLLEARRRVLGEEHPDTRTAMHILVTIEDGLRKARFAR